MPVLQFKGKTAIECYHHTVSHHTLEFDSKLPVADKRKERWLDGDLMIEGTIPWIRSHLSVRLEVRNESI